LISPLFETFTLDDTVLKNATDLDLTIIDFLDTLALNFIFEPHTIIFLVVCDLFIFALAMELTI